MDTNVYWPRAKSSSQTLLTGADGFDALNIPNPILFKVRVPEKNQPKHHGADDVPSDTYWAAWDGIVLVVLWDQNTEIEPLSGGHIVARILEDAVEALGDSLYEQACSPACKNIFLHTSMLLSYDVDELMEEDILVTKQANEGVVEVTLPNFVAESEFETVDWLHSNLDGIGRHFGQVKNYARRLMDIESAIDKEVVHLLQHYYSHARLMDLPMRKSYRLRWKGRRWRRHARYVLAGIWLSLANIEAMKRQWGDAYRDYQGYMDDCGVNLIFAGDVHDDVEVVSALDMEYAASAIRQVSTTLDNRLNAIAAGGGAIAGGVAGALSTLLTSGAF
ncbi:hypothetical protein ABTW95_03445 [Spirillospora sp. NPDC127506]